MAAYHLANLVSRKYAVISVNEDFNQTFLQIIKETGTFELMTSMMTIGRPFKLPLVDFYTPDELEEELLRVGRKQVEEGAQLIVIACAGISILLGPGAFERLSEKLGAIIVDPQKAAIKMAEMLVQLGL